MSWDGWVESLDTDTGKEMNSGGIYGKDGSRWSSKGQLTCQPNEVAALVNIINHTGDEEGKARVNGVKIGGEKFMLLGVDDDDHVVNVTKSVADGKVLTGAVQMTKQAVLVCVCEGSGKNPKARTSTNRIACSLMESGY